MIFLLVENGTGAVFDGLIRFEEQCIYIRYTKKESMEHAIIHEMAHAATNGDHGEEWLNEMLRLKNAGAPTPDAALWIAERFSVPTIPARNHAGRQWCCGRADFADFSSHRLRRTPCMAMISLSKWSNLLPCHNSAEKRRQTTPTWRSSIGHDRRPVDQPDS